MWPFKKKTKTPKLHANLIFCFKDHEGKSYYKFPEQGGMSLERIGAINRYSIFISRGLTNTQLNEMLDLIEAHNFNIGKEPIKSAAKIAGLVHEIRLREKIILPVELLYNYLAAYYVREDEDPRFFNEQAQVEKVSAFRVAANKLDSFFFAMPELKKLCDMLSISTNNWPNLVESLMQNQDRHEKAMEILK